MQTAQIEKKASELATAGITAGLPKLWRQISELFKRKNLTIAKLVRMYAIAEQAVKDMQAIANEK